MTSALAFVLARARDKHLLERAERDAYTNLIEAYAWMGGALPDDDRRLAIAAKCSRASWRRLRPLLAPLFEVADGFWRHAALDRELDARPVQTAEGKREVAPELSAKRRAAAEEKWRRYRAAKFASDLDANLHGTGDANAANGDAYASSSEKPSTAEDSGLQRAGNPQPVGDKNQGAGDAKHANLHSGAPRQQAMRLFRNIKGAKRSLDRAEQSVATPRAPPQPPPAAFAPLWDSICARLGRELGAQRCAYWIAPLCVVSADADRVVIAATSRFERDTLCKDAGIGERIQALIHEAQGERVVVDFIVKAPEADAA